MRPPEPTLPVLNPASQNAGASNLSMRAASEPPPSPRRVATPPIHTHTYTHTARNAACLQPVSQLGFLTVNNDAIAKWRPLGVIHAAGNRGRMGGGGGRTACIGLTSKAKPGTAVCSQHGCDAALLRSRQPGVARLS